MKITGQRLGLLALLSGVALVISSSYGIASTASVRSAYVGGTGGTTRVEYLDFTDVPDWMYSALVLGYAMYIIGFTSTAAYYLSKHMQMWLLNDLLEKALKARDS